MYKEQKSLYKSFKFAIFFIVLYSLEPVNAISKYKEVNFAQQSIPSKDNNAEENQKKTAQQLFNEAQVLYHQGTAESRRIALEKSEQALKIWQKLGVKVAQAKTLNLIGR